MPVASVIKQRGSDHDRSVREYMIREKGLEILDAAEGGAAGPLPWDEYQNLMFGTAQRVSMRPPNPPG